MPSPKGHTLDGWSLADQVEELQGKYHLKKKNCEAHRESCHAEIRLNERVIGSLRQENRNKRILIAQHENGDEKVIKTVFKEQRKERLSLQRYTAPGAIEEMDLKVSQETKTMNEFRAGRENREQKILELEQELERMQCLENSSPELDCATKTVTKVENDLDKASIKYSTACIISNQYRNIVEKLREESLTMPAKLDIMERSLLDQRVELKELQGMSKTTFQARDDARQELAKVEQKAYEAKRLRDAELNTTRKEVERRQHEFDKVDKKPQRNSLIQDSQFDKSQWEKDKKNEIQSKILSFEDAFEKITVATQVTEIEEVVARAVTMETVQEELRSKVSGMESQRNRLQKELAKLKDKFHDMKYTGETKLSGGERLLEQMKEHSNYEFKRQEKIHASLQRFGGTLVKVKTGVTTLLEKLDQVKLSPPEHNFTKGDVFDQLDLTRKKLEVLTKQLKKEMGTGEAATNEQLDETAFQEFLEGKLPSNNVRIKMQASLPQLSDFGYEGQEHNEVLSRADMKRNAQILIDSKQQGKKKKKGKKSKS